MLTAVGVVASVSAIWPLARVTGLTRWGEPIWGRLATRPEERTNRDRDVNEGDAAATDEADWPTAAGTEIGRVNPIKLLTLKEAAVLRGVSPDTVKRAIDARVYPNATRGSGTSDPWQIPLDDLITAGHYDPNTATVEPEVAIRTTRAERELVEVRALLAKAEAAVESLQRELAGRDEQLRWLRRHADALTSTRTAA